MNLFKKKALLLDNLHAELFILVGKDVHCRAVENGKVLFGAHGKLSVSYDHRGLKRYIVSDHNGNTVRFRALELSQIIQHGNITLVTVNKIGYAKD